MNKIIEKENINIEDMIYEIRGVQVMLDSDLARFYQCKNGTKEINQAVKNNLEKFPDRFSWILDDKESKKLLVKIFDQKNKVDKRGGKYKNPRIFIEQGVAMLATILHTPVATEVSVALIDAFVTLRHNYIENKNNNMYIYSKLAEYDEKFEFLFSYFNINKENIYLPGQKYDAYSYIINIFKTSKKELIILDIIGNIKLMGNKTFSIIQLEEESVKQVLLNKIKELV